ncbi:MAG: hypothetical protein IKC64_01380 [Clostridia bacterium]|nr:hypothetical protein [Clostridia bacterium]
MSKTKADKITSALRKKAVGYTSNETVEEYALVDGQMVLVKRKITTKENPPDVTACKLLLELSGEVAPTLSEEEIKAEKIRLIKLLTES